MKKLNKRFYYSELMIEKVPLVMRETIRKKENLISYYGIIKKPFYPSFVDIDKINIRLEYYSSYNNYYSYRGKACSTDYYGNIESFKWMIFKKELKHGLFIEKNNELIILEQLESGNIKINKYLI